MYGVADYCEQIARNIEYIYLIQRFSSVISQYHEDKFIPSRPRVPNLFPISYHLDTLYCQRIYFFQNN